MDYQDRLIPYPITPVARNGLMARGFDCRMNRLMHGEDSKQYNQSLQRLVAYEQNLRAKLGVENV